MEIVVQIATILSPIIAVLLAWWTSKSSEKKVQEQIESIKELARIQIEVSMNQIIKEVEEVHTLSNQYSERIEREDSLRRLGVGWGINDSHEDKVRDLHDNRAFCNKKFDVLMQSFDRLEVLRKRLEGE